MYIYTYTYSCGQKFTYTHQGHEYHGSSQLLLISFDTVKCSQHIFNWANVRTLSFWNELSNGTVLNNCM